MKRTLIVLLVIAVVIGALIGAGTWLKNQVKIEPPDYDAIMQQEYGEHDLEVIDFFNRVKEYGIYVANSTEGTFIFGEDYEAYSTLSTACHFIFDGFTIDKIINGYTRVDTTTGETSERTGGFSESMQNSISYSGNLNICFNELSQKAQYETIQITKEISDIVSSKLSSYHRKPATAKFLENADLLLLGQKEGFIHDKIKESCLGENPDDASYYKYYTTLDTIIKSDGAIKNEFTEAKEIIAGWIEFVKNKIGNG